MKYTFNGGINELSDIAIEATEAVSGQNFELGLGNTKFRPRKPFDLVDTAPAGITGILQLEKRDSSRTTIVTAGTNVYTWDGAGTFTDVGNVDQTSVFDSAYWSLDDKLVIVDRSKATPVSTWDGATFTTLAHNIAGVNLYAKYAIVANGRMILANVKTNTSDNPHLIAFSEYENIENFDVTTRNGDAGFSTGDEPFYMLSPDLKPINGLLFFKDIVICSTTNGQLFKLLGDDSTNYRWEEFYSGSSFIGDSSFVDVQDDIFFMRSGGVIESLRSTDQYGDVGTDDVTVKLRSTIQGQRGMKAVYDQENRKVYFFLASKVLVLFKDMLGGADSPFSVYTTEHPSAFNTDAVRYLVSPASGENTVLFGDDSGNIFDMNGTYGQGDAGDGITVTYPVRTSRKMPLQGASYDQFIEGRLFYRRKRECNLTMTFQWGDERNETDVVVTLKAPSTGSSINNYYRNAVYYGGGNYYSEGLVAQRNPVSRGFSAFGKGTSVFVTLEIYSGEDFEIDYIEV